MMTDMTFERGNPDRWVGRIMENLSDANAGRVCATRLDA